METFIKKAIEKLNKNSEGNLSDKDKKKIHEQFPIPREHKILWGQNLEQNNKYGMVITNIGIFFKASPMAVKQANEKMNKKISYHIYITILSGNFLIQTTLSCAKRVGIRLIYFLMENFYLI